MPATDTAALELSDGQVRLRAHREEDIPRIVEQCTDPRSLRWSRSLPVPYDEAVAREFLDLIDAHHRDGTARFWAVEVDGSFAGTVNLTSLGPGLGELGYGIHPDVRGRGVATKAVRLAIEHAFDVQGLLTLRWQAALGNLASRRVAWATGFHVDGVWPQAQVSSTGEHLDDLVIGHLSRAEPREPRHPWWEPAVLEGNGIRLRAWRESDRPAAAPDELAAPFILSAAMLPTPESYPGWLVGQRSRMARGEGVYWCIAAAESDRAVGGIQVDQLDAPATRGTGSIGYWLDPQVRGRGHLAAALETVIKHAFGDRTDLAGRSGLGLHRLWAGTDARNRASQRVLRRAGFREVLTEQQVLTHNGEAPVDAISFELLASDDRDAQRVTPAPATVLTTERLRLRPWRESDRPAPEQAPDEEARRQLPPGAMPTTDTFETWLARRNRGRDTGTHGFCIADRTTDRPLGTISIFNIDRAVNHGEMGYWLYPHARGRGYVDEALAAVVDHGFRPADEGGAGLDRLYAETNLTNYASRVALLRAGFRHWGEDHQAYIVASGERTDGAYYELLRAWRDEPSRAVAVPVLDGTHVRLRPWRMGDAARIVQACTDPVTRHWLAGLPDPYDEDIARAWVHQGREDAAAGRAVGWCVADRQTDRALGALTLGALRGPRAGTASVGYWTHPDARGRRVATDATGLAISHAFDDRSGPGLRRLALIAAAGNEASQAIARRHGFTSAGLEHQAETLGDGTTADLLRFDLLRDA